MAESASLATERHELVVATIGAAQAQEAVRQDAALQESVELVFDELRQAGTGGFLGLGKEALSVLLHQAARGGGARSAPGHHGNTPRCSGPRRLARDGHGKSGVVPLIKTRAPSHPPLGGHPCPEPRRRPRSRAARSARCRVARPRKPKSLIHRRVIGASHAILARRWVSRQASECSERCQHG